jgi:hypothetical protein
MPEAESDRLALIASELDATLVGYLGRDKAVELIRILDPGLGEYLDGRYRAMNTRQRTVKSDL